jgi:hypothetical protein
MTRRAASTFHAADDVPVSMDKFQGTKSNRAPVDRLSDLQFLAVIR